MQHVTIGDFTFRQRYVCNFIGMFEPLSLLWYQTVSLLTSRVAYYPCYIKLLLWVNHITVHVGLKIQEER